MSIENCKHCLNRDEGFVECPILKHKLEKYFIDGEYCQMFREVYCRQRNEFVVHDNGRNVEVCLKDNGKEVKWLSYSRDGRPGIILQCAAMAVDPLGGSAVYSVLIEHLENQIATLMKHVGKGE